LLAFLGRADAVADLVGEKLHERFVAQALERVARSGAFCTMLPVMPTEGRPHYWLLTDDGRPGLGEAVEAQLEQAVRYREARMLGQLGPLQVSTHQHMRRAVHDALVRAGMKAGDIKDRPLVSSLELARRMSAQLDGVHAAAV
jgi:hypothetical protein